MAWIKNLIPNAFFWGIYGVLFSVIWWTGLPFFAMFLHSFVLLQGLASHVLVSSTIYTILLLPAYHFLLKFSWKLASVSRLLGGMQSMYDYVWDKLLGFIALGFTGGYFVWNWFYNPFPVGSVANKVYAKIFHSRQRWLIIAGLTYLYYSYRKSAEKNKKTGKKEGLQLESLQPQDSGFFILAGLTFVALTGVRMPGNTFILARDVWSLKDKIEKWFTDNKALYDSGDYWTIFVNVLSIVDNTLLVVTVLGFAYYFFDKCLKEDKRFWPSWLPIREPPVDLKMGLGFENKGHMVDEPYPRELNVVPPPHDYHVVIKDFKPEKESGYIETCKKQELDRIDEAIAKLTKLKELRKDVQNKDKKSVLQSTEGDEDYLQRVLDIDEDAQFWEKMERLERDAELKIAGMRTDWADAVDNEDFLSHQVEDDLTDAERIIEEFVDNEFQTKTFVEETKVIKAIPDNKLSPKKKKTILKFAKITLGKGGLPFKKIVFDRVQKMKSPELKKAFIEWLKKFDKLKFIPKEAWLVFKTKCKAILEKIRKVKYAKRKIVAESVVLTEEQLEALNQGTRLAVNALAQCTLRVYNHDKKPVACAADLGDIIVWNKHTETMNPGDCFVKILGAYVKLQNQGDFESYDLCMMAKAICTTQWAVRQIEVGSLVNFTQFKAQSDELHIATGPVNKVEGYLSEYAVDSEPGDSGGVIFSTEGKVVVGIHRGKYTVGDRTVKQFINLQGPVASFRSKVAQGHKTLGN